MTMESLESTDQNNKQQQQQQSNEQQEQQQLLLFEDTHAIYETCLQQAM